MEVKIENEKKSQQYEYCWKSPFLEFNYLKMFFIKGHWRLLRYTKVQIKFLRNGKNNDMGIKLKLSIYDT